MTQNILIIGGTGMLREATEYFIANDHTVTVVARTIKRLNDLTHRYPDKRVQAVSLDYTKTDSFITVIQKMLRTHPPFDVVISWMHSTANDTLHALIDTLAATRADVPFYHIKGSSSYNPANILHFGDKQSRAKLDYREIILGFTIDNGTSRWLTNSEISSGVIKAITTNCTRHTVGVTEPWDQRP